MGDRELRATGESEVEDISKPPSNITMGEVVEKEFNGEHLSDPAVLRAAAEAVCDMIHTADIVYRDAQGRVLFTHHMGRVESGFRITAFVPRPSSFHLT